MGKEIIAQAQETQRIPNKINPRRNTPTHINQINKDQTQRTNIKTSKGKQQITHKGIPVRITADLSIETLQSRREWQDMNKVMEEKKPTTKITLPSKDLIHMKEKSKALQISKS